MKMIPLKFYYSRARTLAYLVGLSMAAYLIFVIFFE